MATQPRQYGSEPRGFGRHSRGRAGQNAHEQGWGLNLEQRKRESTLPQNAVGGTGDEPSNTQFAPAEIASQIATETTGRTQTHAVRSNTSPAGRRVIHVIQARTEAKQ